MAFLNRSSARFLGEFTQKLYTSALCACGPQSRTGKSINASETAKQVYFAAKKSKICFFLQMCFAKTHLFSGHIMDRYDLLERSPS
jgi:hypothetical protein